MNKYKEYKASDFLEDEFFRQSVLKPTRASDDFWAQMLYSNFITVSEYEEARAILKNFVLSNAVEISDDESQKLWRRIHDSTNNYHRKVKIHRYMYTISSVACMLIVLLCYNRFFTSQDDLMMQMAKEDLTLSLDTLASIQLVMANQIIDLDGNEANIDYRSTDSVSVNNQQLEKDVDTYNQIIVPYGKRSFLVLDDGTRIWINAGSQVIYPTKFSDSERSIVVKGEVYAEVAKDSKRPFHIVTENLKIEVLGTSFNISDYSTENQRSVVLVEGSVKVKSKTSNSKTSVLKPNEMFSSTDQMTEIKTVDISQYIAWKDGLYHFKNKPLSEVLNAIRKYYHVEIACSETTSSIMCTGSIDLKENVDQVIKGISYAVSVDFEKTENKFIIR